MDEKKDLQAVAARCRKRIISMIYKANAGHPGGSLSIADIITVIFQKYMTKEYIFCAAANALSRR